MQSDVAHKSSESKSEHIPQSANFLQHSGTPLSAGNETITKYLMLDEILKG